MSKFINSIFSKPDAARLRRAFCVSGPDEYGQLLSIISSDVLSSEEHGVLRLDLAWTLAEAGFCEVTFIEIKGYIGDFLIYSLAPKLVTGMKRFREQVIMGEPDLYLPHDLSDPYTRPFDHLGDLEEDDPRFSRIPKHHVWGEQIFLMTEARLADALTGDWTHLVHRTPYRPLPSWDAGQDNRLLDADVSELG